MEAGCREEAGFSGSGGMMSPLSSQLYKSLEA